MARPEVERAAERVRLDAPADSGCSAQGLCGNTFPVACDEAERKACLNSLRILDSPAELNFDRITSVVTTAFSIPIALVSFVDAERQ